MIAVVRILFSLSALLLGWSSIVTILAGLYWWAWNQLANQYYLGIYVSAPPAFEHWLLLFSITSVMIVGVVTTVYLLTPVTWMVRALVNGLPVKKVVKGSELELMVEDLCNRRSISKPVIYISMQGPTGAFCLSSLFSGAIVVSEDIVRYLSVKQIKWILAHEVSHLKHFDSFVNAIWLSIYRVLRLARLGHYYLLNNLWNLLAGIGMPSLIITVFIAPIAIILFIGRAIEYLSRYLFLSIDRYLSRLTEYRCDREASEITDTESGIEVFKQLNQGIEPGFNMFATHPTSQARIDNLISTLKHEASIAG
jgi:heat shock protein HtpX